MEVCAGPLVPALQPHVGPIGAHKGRLNGGAAVSARTWCPPEKFETARRDVSSAANIQSLALEPADAFSVSVEFAETDLAAADSKA